MSLPPEQEHDLVVRIQQGYPDDSARAAFDTLYAAYDRQIYGFIRGRTPDDQSAQQVAQDTRLQVWDKMPTYDATRAPFPAFAKYWAGFMLLRYYAAQQRQRTLEVLFSELQQRFPGLQDEQEIGDLLARFAAYQGPSVEDEKVADEDDATQDVEVYEELLRLTFGEVNPPHQAMAVGFRTLPDPETSQDVQTTGASRGWPPRRIVQELSDTRLALLAQRLEDGYVHTSHLPEERVRGHFTWLRQSMERRFDEVVTEPRTRQTHATLLSCPVGPTTFRHYYTHRDNPAQDVTQWCDAVKRRVWSAVKHLGDGPLFRLLQAAADHTQGPRRRRHQDQAAHD